jgi:hypothetical protein
MSLAPGPKDPKGGNLSNLLSDISNSDAGALEITADALGTLADLSGTIGLIQFGYSVYQDLSGKDDELQTVLAAIQAGFNQLQGQISASDKLQRMRDIDNGINEAFGVFQQLPAWLAANPPLTEEFKLDKISICVDAVDFFSASDVRWQVAAADMPYYSDSWSGTLAPQTNAGLAFNYTYTLPQFLRAIYFLLTTIAALAPTSLKSYNNVLTNALTRLQSVHQTIVSSGIVGYREPSSPVVGTASYLLPGQGLIAGQTFPTGPPVVGAQGSFYQHTGIEGTYQIGGYGWDSSLEDHFFCKSGWITQPTTEFAQDGIMWPYGAVEIYSGANNVSSYVTDYFPDSQVDLSFWPQAATDNFLRLLNVRVQQKMRSLYVSLGMPAVWQTINQLAKLTDQPPPSTRAYGEWPLTDLIDQLQLAWTPPPPQHHLPGGAVGPQEPADPTGFEDALRAVLQATPPYAEFPAFTNAAVTNPGLLESLRENPDWYSYTVSTPPTPVPTGSLYSFLTGISLAPVVHQ